MLPFSTCPSWVHTYIGIPTLLLPYCVILGKIPYIPRPVSSQGHEQTELEWPASFLPLYVLFIYKLYLSLKFPVP